MFQKILKYIWFIWLAGFIGILITRIDGSVKNILIFSFITLSIIIPILGLIGAVKKNISRKWFILSIVCLIPILLTIITLLLGASQGAWM